MEVVLIVIVLAVVCMSMISISGGIAFYVSTQEEEETTTTTTSTTPKSSKPKSSTPAPVPEPEPAPEYAHYIASHSGKCIGVDDNNNIVQQECDEAKSNQKWAYNPISKALKSKDGKCLDVTSAGKDDGVNIQHWVCNNSFAQQWDREGNTFKNINSGKCLDVTSAGKHNGANIQQWGCNNSDAQEFAAFFY